MGLDPVPGDVDALGDPHTIVLLHVVQQALQAGRPMIFNTDQGSQFTSLAFTSVLRDAEVRISMDGRGRWMDNVFIERLWRSVKYEEVYLKGYETIPEARQELAA